MVRKIRLVICIAIFVANQPLFAETKNLIECGAAKGWGYYLPGDLVPKGKDGWVKDGYTKGNKLRLVYDGKSYDIIYVDATGNERSATESGAVVTRLKNSEPDILMVVAIYPRIADVEYFMFHYSPTEDWSVVWGIARSGLMRGGKVLVAKCKSQGG